jgi:hypothetical protein
MDPETDIETRTRFDRPRRASRAPWDPPPRPAMPGAPRRRKTDGDGRLQGADAFGGYDDDLGRGAD